MLILTCECGVRRFVDCRSGHRPMLHRGRRTGENVNLNSVRDLRARSRVPLPLTRGAPPLTYALSRERERLPRQRPKWGRGGRQIPLGPEPAPLYCRAVRPHRRAQSFCRAQSSLSSLTTIVFFTFFAGGSILALPPTGVGERGGGPCHAAAPAWLRGTGVAARAEAAVASGAAGC
jgi:hypothetical protein